MNRLQNDRHGHRKPGTANFAVALVPALLDSGFLQAQPLLAQFNEHSLWMTSTVVALSIVALFGTLAGVSLYIARRMHWVTKATEIRIRRRMRVGFGGLFLAAATLPYMFTYVPTLAAVICTVAAFAALQSAYLSRTNATPATRDSSDFDSLE